MTLADRILETLYDRNAQSVWLEELQQSCKASRAQLERAVGELRQRGHEIELSPAGLRLVRPTVLDAHLLERDLPVGRVGKHVVCFPEVDSTNDVAFAALATAEAPDAAVVITAESQRAGRGRLGRTWVSEPGSGILASVGLADSRAELAHEPLTIAAGLAVAEGIERATGIRTELEWPNDVAWEGCKLAGVLVEIRQGPWREIVIGFGINVTLTPDGGQVARRTACLAQAGASTLERIEILRQVLVAMDRWLADIAAGQIAGLHQGWMDRCRMLNQRITAERGGRRVTGRVADISPMEGLLVLDDHGKGWHFPAATTSIVRP